MPRLVDVYPYCLEQNEVKFLLFKRSPDVVYANQWRMIGGKITDNEKAYQAGLRELEEETGIANPELFWVLPSVNQFYDHSADVIRQVPAFAAAINAEEKITLNHEHVECRWVSYPQIEQYNLWPEQRRLIALLENIITNQKLIDDWIISAQK